MSTVPGSIKSLRAYYKKTTFKISIKELKTEIKGESDRAAVILMASTLDDALSTIIWSSMKSKRRREEFDDVFRFEGPLGTFSSKAEIAYHFGIIDKLTFDQISTIREMRNACAHSKRALDFDVPELRNVAKRLFYPNGSSKLLIESKAQLKVVFVLECTLILYMLAYRCSREKAVQKLVAINSSIAEHFPSLDKPIPQGP